MNFIQRNKETRKLAEGAKSIFLFGSCTRSGLSKRVKDPTTLYLYTPVFKSSFFLSLSLHFFNWNLSYNPRKPAMAISRSLLLLLPFLLVAIAAAVAHASDASVPFLLAHKKVSLERLKSGSEQVTVSIDLYNEGSTCVLINSLDFFSVLFDLVCQCRCYDL